MAETELVKLVLSSSFEEIEKVESYVKSLQERLDFHNDEFARIMLALSEAVTNAIVHGNEEEESKSVTIRSRLENEGRLKISVEDEGKGFDREELPDPLKEENLLKEGGRGVYLIEQYTDGMEYNEKGTRITMTFEI